MRTAIRTEVIEIDLIDPDGFTWVTASIQKTELDEDDNIKSISGREDKLYRRIDRVATEMIVATDPVTGQQITVSVAGLGALITTTMVKWMLEDNPKAFYETESNLVILNE